MSNKVLKLCNVIINAKGFKLLFLKHCRDDDGASQSVPTLKISTVALDRIFANLFFKVKLLAHILEND